MFSQIRASLHRTHLPPSFQVDSKFLVGLGGILVVGCSVLASMGFYAWIGIPSSLIILQVVPFLVLAVGADNIFIFVLEHQVRGKRVTVC